MTITSDVRSGNHVGIDANVLCARQAPLVVAGITKKNLKPRVWDPESPYYIPELRAIMVSYADFHRRKASRDAAMAVGLRAYLDVPETVRIFLDNGAFSLLNGGTEPPVAEYEEFVVEARPDWYPIPLDYIPSPAMDAALQRRRFEQTMTMNRTYHQDGFVPVVHAGLHLQDFVSEIEADGELSSKPSIALGGLVPNLLRRSKARPYDEVLATLHHMRQAFRHQQIHVFGIGGTATLHLAALLGIDSVDSSGWRNRAARGLIQLPGTGDRIAVQLGNWRGRGLSSAEDALLETCDCPACQQFGHASIRERGLDGASHRATHNLWVLLQESRLITRHLADGSYSQWSRGHLDNTTYAPLIELAMRGRYEKLSIVGSCTA